MKFFGNSHSSVILFLMFLCCMLLFVSKFNILLTFLFLFLTTSLTIFFDRSSLKGHRFLFVGILSILFTLGKQIKFSTVSTTYKENLIDTTFSLEKVVVFLSCFMINYFILRGLEYITSKKWTLSPTKIGVKNILNNPLTVFTVLIIFWLPYLLALYPGCILPDSLSSINQALGLRPLSNHHPVIFTLFLKFFINSFSFLGLNKSIFIYVLFQTIIFASILSYFMCWLKKYEVSTLFRLLTFLYFALAPVFPIYALNVQKDTLFTSYLFLFSLKCIDTVVTRKLNNWSILVLVSSGVLATFYRNNGVYVVLMTFTILTIMLIKQKRIRQSIIIAVSYLAVSFLLISPLVSRYSVPTAAAESLGIPLQQVSRTVVLKGDMSKKDKKYLDKLLPISEYEEYSPMLVDSIKWNPKFNNQLLNDDPLRFIKVWARLLPKNFKVYVDAYLLNTYGFWAPFEKNYYGFLDTRVNANDLNIKQIDLIQKGTSSDVMQRIIEKRNFLGSGTLFCLMIIGFYLYWIKKRQFLWIGYLPSFLTWLSIMVATPVAFSLRYVFILAMSLPLFFCLPFLKFKAR